MDQELQNIADIPTYIFGNESTITSADLLSISGNASYSEPWFIIAALGIVALYLTWINHWSARGDNHRQLFGLFTYMQSDYTAKLGEAAPSFSSYINSGSLFGVLAIWVGATSILQLPSSDNLTLSALTLAGVVALYLYQLLIVYIIGKVAESGEFFKVIRHFKAISYSVTGVVLLPLALCYALTRGEMQNIFMYITAFLLLIVLFIFLYKTFMLFLSKKVSVLHTILYLCAVEIFPITLVWGFFCR